MSTIDEPPRLPELGYSGATTFDDIDTVLTRDIVGEVAALLATVAAVVLVRSLTRRQTTRIAEQASAA